VGGRFLFSGDDIEKKIASLSGGERARLLLAKLMIQGPNFLVMDEPTNHLDIASREVVETALDEFEGTLLTVSHDRYFLDKECDHIWEIEDGKVTCYEGNYTAYREEKAKRLAHAAAEAPAKPKKPEPVAPPSANQVEREEKKEAKAKSGQLEKRQAELEKRIAELEASKKELEDSFLDPSRTRDPQMLLALKKEHDQVKDELDAAFDKWQELEERKSAV
jgi:ATP-binding cassette subfamily F protein 3